MTNPPQPCAGVRRSRMISYVRNEMKGEAFVPLNDLNVDEANNRSSGRRDRLSTDLKPSEIDQTTWEHALVEASRVALSLRSGLAVSSLSLNSTDTTRSILYRPPWLYHRDFAALLPAIRHATTALIDHAVSLVASGYRPDLSTGDMTDESDTPIWPMTNVLQVATNDWPFSVPERREEAARIALDAAWSMIEQLAISACDKIRLSVEDVWDIAYPESASSMTADAYHLAARAWASSTVGVEPVYLSIFNFRGQRMALRERSGRLDALTPDEEILVTFAGPVASLMSTGTIVVDGSRTQPSVQTRASSRYVVDSVLALATFSRCFGPETERALVESWDIVEHLATLLLREYNLVGREIHRVLWGADIDSWAPSY